MTGPSPRPTREAVERALVLQDGSVLAAEVRALRAELAAVDDDVREALEASRRGDESGYETAQRVRAVLDGSLALAARTPQPADLVQGVELKATREALCAAQSALGARARAGTDVERVPHWIARLQVLCDAIDVHRPLGPDGKHGDRHTPTCGCEDAAQPTDPADTAQVGDRLGTEWLDAQESIADGGCRAPAPGGVWMCTRSAHAARQHVATLGSRVVAVWPAVAPQPVVPDGELPEVVTLCGSMRFLAQMLRVAAQETAAGRIVLAPFPVPGADADGDVGAMLDELHRRKIDLSSRIIVVSDGTGYYGTSTAGEIAYAREQGKPVEFRRVADQPSQPAVPDGEDARDLAEIRRVTETHPEAPRGELLAEVRRLVENDDHCTTTHRTLDGEDVPARLDAAAEALDAADWGVAAEQLRCAAEDLRGEDQAEVRAAVAAALTHTPHEEAGRGDG